MDRPMRWHNYLTINMNWFALTVRSQVLTPLIIPLLVQQFVGEEMKGTYVGVIRLWALMVAVLVQALMGLLSDRSKARLGRRRPFILVGALGESVVLILIGFVAGLDGMTGFWALFAVYIFSMIFSNTSHSATQGLIPDLVPDEKKGVSSGVKALFELPLPLIFVSFVIGKLVSAGNLWGALIAVIVVLLISMAISMFAPEKRFEGEVSPFDWTALLRLLLMTAFFTGIILGCGALVQLVFPLAAGMAATGQMLLVGGAGLLGMSLALVVGVLVSTRISLGQEAVANRSFVWWIVSRLAFMVSATNLAGFMVFFLQERFPDLQGAEAAGPAANLVLFVGVGILLTSLPAGFLADRFGKKLLISVAALLGALGTAIVLLGTSFTLMYVGGAVVGTGMGLFYASSWALGATLAPAGKAGQFLGLSNLAGAGAGAIGAYIGGPIADQVSYVLLMSIYAAIFLVAALTLIPIVEERKGP